MKKLSVAVLLAILASVTLTGAVSGQRTSDDGKNLAAAAQSWANKATHNTHFALGAHGHVKDSTSAGYKDGLAIAVSCSIQYNCCDSALGYCLTYSPGCSNPGTPCADVDKLWVRTNGQSPDDIKSSTGGHFDCVGFVSAMFQQIGKHMDYMGKPFDSGDWTVVDLVGLLGQAPGGSSIHPNNSGSPFSCAGVSLNRGDILIFSDVDSNGQIVVGKYEHSAICSVGSGEPGGPKMVSCRVDPLKGNCHADNSGVIEDDLQGFLDIANKAWSTRNDPNSIYNCYAKNHGFEGYITTTPCIGRLTICKYDDLNLDSVGQPSEGVDNWPFHIDGPNGFSKDVTTGSNGCVSVDQLAQGTYTITEKVTLDAGGTTFNDPRPGYTKRWRTEGAISQQINSACGNQTVSFLNICLGSITARKFEDCNMNGMPDGSENGILGWPLTLTGNTADGKPIASVTAKTDSNGYAKFQDLLPGDYTLSEAGDGLTWEKVSTTCGGVSYCDWRTSFNGKRYQATYPRPPDNCDSAGLVPSIGPITVACSDVTNITFGNVPLTTVRAFKWHDINMDGVYEPDGETFTDLYGLGKWSPGESFTDDNCNGHWDPGEYFDDTAGNGVYLPPDPFVDRDGDGQYDWPECPIQGWPFLLAGVRADGKPVCMTALTDSSGWVEIKDVAPSDSAGGYTLSENVAWSKVSIGGEDVYRTSFTAQPVCTVGGSCDKVDRWQATTATLRNWIQECDKQHPDELFGNVCLSRLIGTKEQYDNGMPLQSNPAPGVGWKIDLAGRDHKGRSVVPSAPTGSVPYLYWGWLEDNDINTPIQPGYPDSGLLPPAAKAPIDIPCQAPEWYETSTDSAGHFVFLDLLPGHYHLAEQPDCNYRLSMSQPMLCGFDMSCCPQTVTMRNIRKGLSWKIYQVYPGTSEGAESVLAGYNGKYGDPISAVPGVLKICSGNGWWTNYIQANQLCRPTVPKNVSLTKTYQGAQECSNVFTPMSVRQQGTPNIRLWWPLMYEAPGTTWTLSVFYGTQTSVQFPGECSAGYAHEDDWSFVVDTDIEHMKLLVDLFRETPFGTDEVPLISDEVLYTSIQSKLDQVNAAMSAGDTFNAGASLSQFEMELSDACITTSPTFPDPHGLHTGVAETDENPACCKLLVDSEYVAAKLGLWSQSK